MRLPAPPGRAEAARSAADEVLDRLRRWDTGALLPGFLFDHDATPDAVRRAYSEADHRRLSALKARYDPDRLFRVNHNIAPAAS
ncbi:BBE domain-containing protein [Nonomuraea sp. NPDC001684]